MSALYTTAGARARLASALIVVAGVAACPAEPPEDVDLGTLQLRVWQPEALAIGSGDLLDDASRVEVTLVVDGEEQKVALDDGLSAAGREASAEGSEISATLRTSGSALPDALGRSGRVRLEPGGGDVTITTLLAPPDVVHELSASLPNPRSGMAVCSSARGRLWAVGGLLGTTVTGGSFVLDHAAREVREGPALAARAFAACVADDGAGVYLAGGCSDEGVAAGTLDYSDTGELGSRFETVAELPGAGCHTRVTRTSAGSIVALHGSLLWSYAPDDDEVSTLTLPAARYAGVLAAFPGEGERVLVSGGFSNEARTLPQAGSLVVDLADPGAAPVTLSRAFVAAAREGDGLVVVDGADVARVAPDGSIEPILSGAIPGTFTPAQIAPLYDGRYALLSRSGSSVLVVGGAAPKTLALAAPREQLWSDPGGALVLAGGATAGLSLIVVE